MYTVEILNRDFGKVYEGLSKASKSYDISWKYSEPYVKINKEFGNILTQYRTIEFDIDFKYQYICKLTRIRDPKKFDFKVQDEVDEIPYDFLKTLTDLRCSHCNKKLENGYLFKVDDEYIILGRNCTDDFCGESLKRLMWKHDIFKIVEKAQEFSTERNIKPKRSFPADYVLDILLDVSKDGFVPKSYKNSTYDRLLERLSDFDPSVTYEVKEETKSFLEDIRKTKGTNSSSESVFISPFYHDYINEEDLGCSCVVVSKKIKEKIIFGSHPDLDPFKDSKCIGEVGKELEFVPKTIEYKGNFTSHNAFSYDLDVVNIYEINYNGNRLKMFTTSNKDFSKLIGKPCICKVKGHEPSLNTTIVKLLKEKK